MTPISGNGTIRPFAATSGGRTGQRHENVAADEQQDGVDCVHVYVFFQGETYENKVVAWSARAEKRRLRQLVAQFVIRLLVIKLLLNGKITIFAMG